jgi:hypothetical protein
LFRIGMYPESNHSVYVFYVSLALDWRIQWNRMGPGVHPHA